MKAREAYHAGSDFQHEHERIRLGALTSFTLTHDPIQASSLMSRYKFCSKMMEGNKSVIEIGSGDGIGIPLLAQTASHVYYIDRNRAHIDSIERRLLPFLKNVTLVHFDVTEGSPEIKAEGALMIDILDRIAPTREKAFMEHILACLPTHGVLLTGIPNKTGLSEEEISRHPNAKNMDILRELMKNYFKHVFMFGMNDEVLHTGYAPMCHYIWSLAAEKKHSENQEVAE